MDELFVVCRAGEIEDSQVTSFVLQRAGEGGKAEPWPIMVTRKSNRFFAYENNCPHEGGRLDTTPGEFLDDDGNFIACGRHKAMFDPDTGHCFIGPCRGANLTPVAVVIDDGDLCITGVQLAEEDGLDLAD